MTELVIIAVVVFAFAMVSRKLALSPVTAPMVFTAAGVLLGLVGAQWFQLDLKSEAVSVLVEATLVLVLFTDAVRIDIRALRKQVLLPLRLLGIGLPLTIALGTVAAAALFGQLSLIEAALIAAILAPTDAALGQAVVSDTRLPVRIRQALNVESGLNDGIMVPVVTVFLAISAAHTGVVSDQSWGAFAAQQIGFGITFGGGVGALGGWLPAQAGSRVSIASWLRSRSRSRPMRAPAWLGVTDSLLRLLPASPSAPLRVKRVAMFRISPRMRGSC